MKDLYNKLVPFLRDTFLDVKESGRSFKQYFEPRAGNIEQFKQTPLFKRHLLQYKERNEIVEKLFEKMTKDFNDGVAHLYMPIGEGGEGHFTEEQKLIFYKLADLITQQTGAPTVPPSPKETISATTKNLEEAGNLKVVQPLKLNPKTGFIEGKVINPNDSAELLSVFIDPNNPDEIIFQKGNIAFVLENSVNGLGIFIGAPTQDVMALAGHVKTAGGILPESTVLGTLPSGAMSPGTTSQGTLSPGAPTPGALSKPELKPELSGLQPGAETAGAETEATRKSMLPEFGMEPGAGPSVSGTPRTPGLPGAPRPLYKPVRAEMATPQRIPEYATNLNEPQLKAPLGSGPGRHTEQGLKKSEEREPERRSSQPQTTEEAAEEAQPGKNKKSSKGKAALLAGAVGLGGIGSAIIAAAADIV